MLNKFQELLELAQRKFLRQITGYTSSESSAFPRIILIDFWTQDELQQQAKVWMRKERKRKEEERAAARQKEEEKNSAECPDAASSQCPDEKKNDDSFQCSENSEPKEKTDVEETAEKNEDSQIHPSFEDLEVYGGPGSEFCVRLMCEHEQAIRPI